MTGPDRAGGARGAPVDFDPIVIGTDIQRRIGVKTSRDEPLARFTTMRVGGPADLFAVAHNAFELRALVKFVRSRGHPPPDPRPRERHRHRRRRRPRAGHPGPGRGHRGRRGSPGGRVRCADGPRRDGHPGRGAVRPRVRAGHPGHGRWLGLGQRRGPRIGRPGGPRERPGDGRRRPRGAARRRRPGAGLPGQPAQAPLRSGGAAGGRRQRHLPAQPGDPDEIRERLDDIRRWRQAHQPLGIPSAGSYFRNPPGDSAGRLIEAAGLKGTRLGGASVSEKHANFLVNDRKGTADDVRRLGERVRAEVATRFGVELEPEVVFVGDWGPSWAEAAR